MSDLVNAFSDGTTFGVTALGVDDFRICQTGGGYLGKGAESDGLVYYNWHPGQELVNDQLGGGDLTSAPAVAGDHVVARGKNGNLWYRKLGSGSWSPFPELDVTSAPALCVEPGGTLHVFARGLDLQLWHTFKAPQQEWIPWRRKTEGIPDLPGGMKSAPSVVSPRAGRVDIVAQGNNNEVWHLVYDNGWAQWNSLGGTVTARPTCCWWDESTLHVFARGLNSQIWHRYFDWAHPDGLGRWTNWGDDVPAHPSSLLNSAPVSVVDASGRVDIFARAAGAEVWNVRWTDSKWQPWKPIRINSVNYSTSLTG